MTWALGEGSGTITAGLGCLHSDSRALVRALAGALARRRPDDGSRWQIAHRGLLDCALTATAVALGACLLDAFESGVTAKRPSAACSARCK